MISGQIENYFNQLPEYLQEIAWQLRDIILQTHPAVQEKFSYQCPFYYYKKYMCYINDKKDYLDLGFAQGVDIKGFDDYLDDDNGKRKQVRSLKFYDIKDIDKYPLHQILTEAMIIQDKLKNKTIK